MKKIRRKKIRIITEQLFVVRSGGAEESANRPKPPASVVCPVCHSPFEPALPPPPAASRFLDEEGHQCSETE